MQCIIPEVNVCSYHQKEILISLFTFNVYLTRRIKGIINFGKTAFTSSFLLPQKNASKASENLHRNIILQFEN